MLGHSIMGQGVDGPSLHHCAAAAPGILHLVLDRKLLTNCREIREQQQKLSWGLDGQIYKEIKRGKYHVLDPQA